MLGTSPARGPRRLAPLATLALVAALSACTSPATDARPATPAPAPAPVASAPAVAPAPAPVTAPAPDLTRETATPTPDPAPAVAARPLYYEQAIMPADLDGRTLRELTLLRNWIYARVGQSFRKPWIDTHFRQFAWYAPLPAPELGKLTPIDYANAQAIVDHEQAITKATMIELRTALLAKKSAGGATVEDDIELELLAVRLGGWTDEPELKPEDLSPLADPEKLDALLAANQLATLSLRDLRMLRNTIYARRGRPFRSTLLQSYFADMDWYKPDDGYDDTHLTAVDRKNIRLVTSVEKANGGPLTDYEHKVEEGWFFAA